LRELEHEAAWREIMGHWYEKWAYGQQPFTDELLRQSGVRLLNGYVNVWDETPQSLENVKDALFELLAEDADEAVSESITIEVTGNQRVYRDVPLEDLLTAKSWRELSRLLPNISYLDAAKRGMAESYGSATTDNPSESGFLLADGSWLRMGRYGGRGDDHRVVVEYVRGKTRREAETGSRWAALVHWMQVTKSIRWMPESCMFELWTKPTRAQLSAMREMGRDCELEGVTVEVNNRGKVYERTFERRELAGLELWIDRAWRGVLHGDEKR
jgi:hypothetical protein